MNKNLSIVWGLLLGLIFSVFISFNVHSQQLAFPTAEGFGAYSQGGRGGDVYHVTNLDDDGVGSLRYGIEKASGPRTVVFDVSGTIELQSGLKLDDNYMTIAGQTAPGDGICLRNYTLSVSAEHIILRYIRARLGDAQDQTSDAMSINSGKNIIIDHCSASWSVDEVLSASTRDPKAIDQITVQWCVISEALRNSIHSKGAHGYGALIRGCYGAQYSYIHNLFAHNVTRNPRPGNYDDNPHTADPLGLQFDFRNNVLYNWKGSAPGYDGDSSSVCRMNYVSNYIKPGPDSDLDGNFYRCGSRYFKGYFSGNSFNGTIPVNQYDKVEFKGTWTQEQLDSYKQSEPFSTGHVKTLTAQEAYNSVINHVGASNIRDSVDTRVINDVKNVTGSMIDSQTEVGGWPVLNSLPAPVDTDKDGMPDSWEIANGLNSNDINDRNSDRNYDGYTNLEEYLNSLENPNQNVKPHVVFVNANSDKGFLISDTIAVNAYATDYNSGVIEKLEVFLDDSVNAILSQVFDTSSCELDTVLIINTEGKHSFIVKATDDSGNVAIDTLVFFVGSTYYSISLVDSSINGDVVLTPTGNTYVNGMEVSCKFIPNFPYLFDAWTGDTSGNENPLVLVLDSNISLNIKTTEDTNVTIKVNFQPDNIAIPEGYIADYGYQYGARDFGYTYGWVDKNNMETRSRYVGEDIRYKTINHFQKEGINTWEINVPNGSYYINLVCGDGDNYNQTNNIDVEDEKVVDPDGEDNFDEYVLPLVEVLDNKLTLRPSAAELNAKICFIVIDQIADGEYLLKVNSGSGDGLIMEGSIVNISADAPPIDSIFDKWIGDTSAIADIYSSTTSITMPSQAIGVTAVFKVIPTYELIVNKGTGDGAYIEGVVVDIKADSPVGDSAFVKWTGDISFITDTLASSTKLTMPSQAIAIVASYIYVPKYEVTVNGGSGDGFYEEGKFLYIKGDSIIDGYEFDKWTGDTSYISDFTNKVTYIIMPAQSVVVTANYKPISTSLSAELFTLSSGLQMKCYPNPFSENAEIRFSLNKSTEVNLTMYNLTGERVLSIDNQLYPAGDHHISISKGALKAGVYLLKMSTNENSDLIQLMIK